MKARFRAVCVGLVWIGLGLGIMGCATIEDDAQRQLSRGLNASAVSEMTLTKRANGLLTVPIMINGSRPLNFIIDTGATKSAIYKPTAVELGLPLSSETSVRIFGMVESALRPEITVQNFQIGQDVFAQLPIAILAPPTGSDVSANERPPDGILALDILAKYQIFYDHKTQKLKIKPNSERVPTIPPSWKRIELMSNPFVEDGRDLKFFEIRMVGPNSFALLDTGSEVNIMNWKVARYPALKILRRRLKENWVLSGAVGQFSPRVRTRVDRIRAGQKFWTEQDFLVMDFEHLNILGIDDQPFVIGGAELLNDSTFLLDFRHNILAIAPDNRDPITGFEVTRRTGILADFFGRTGSRVRR